MASPGHIALHLIVTQLRNVRFDSKFCPSDYVLCSFHLLLQVAVCTRFRLTHRLSLSHFLRCCDDLCCATSTHWVRLNRRSAIRIYGDFHLLPEVSFSTTESLLFRTRCHHTCIPSLCKEGRTRVMTPNPKRFRRSHFRSNKEHCLLCSRRTWEEERLLEALASLERGKSPQRMYDLNPPLCRTGHECSECQRFVCTDCVNCFLDFFETKMIPPPDFFWSPFGEVSPCCWLDKLGWDVEQAAMPPPPFLPSDDCLQGSIFLLEYSLTIGNTPEQNMDVFSYGRSKACPNPILHAVIDDTSLIGVRPRGRLEDRGTIYHLDMIGNVPGDTRSALPPL